MLKINPLELPFVSFQERKILPASPGIYFAISSNDEILYIGRSTNLRNRWKSHHRAVQLKSQSEDIRLAWLQVDDESLLGTSLEKRYQPCFEFIRCVAWIWVMTAGIFFLRSPLIRD